MTDNSTTPSRINHADESIKGRGNIRIDIVAPDPKHLSAIAIAISLMCFLFTAYCGHLLVHAEYWLQRNEAFLEQLSNQGIKVPCDLLPHNEGCKK